MESETLQDAEANHEVLEIGSWHPAHRPECIATMDEMQDSLNGGRTITQDYSDGSAVGQEIFNNDIKPGPLEASSSPSVQLQSLHAEGFSQEINRHQISLRNPPLEPSFTSVRHTLPAKEQTEEQNPTMTPEFEIMSYRGEDVGVERADTHLKAEDHIEDGFSSTHTMPDNITFTTKSFEMFPGDLPNPSQGFDFELDLQPAFSRSTSFPEVPPLHKNHRLNSMTPLLHSQVEDIMEEIGGISHMEESSSFDIDRDLQGGLPTKYNADAEEDSFFPNVGGIGNHETSTLADEEARFEEGMPLVQGHDDNTNEQELSFDAFVPGGSDDDFFAHVLGDHSRPQRLDRKMTSQVLGSMTFPPHEETHRKQIEDQPLPSPQALTSGSIPVSTSTIISDVMTEQVQSNEEGKEDLFRPAGNKKPDEDLDALWQAALGDDDLLEDEPSMDSFTFLDEGSSITDFQPLEEQHESASSNSSSQHASLIQQSTYSPNGAFRSNLSQSSMSYTGSGQQSPYGVSGSLPRPGMPEKTQSFADKAKGGYMSPYDLPMDVTSRSKKRTITQQLPNRNQNLANLPVPPPRNNSTQLSTAYSNGTAPSQPSSAAVTRPSLPPTAFSPTAPPRDLSSASVKSAKGTFFEELPVVAKIRSSSNYGKPLSPASPPIPAPLQTPDYRAPLGQQPKMPEASPKTLSDSANYQLLPPERVSPYSNTATASTAAQVLPALNPRYSPVPPVQPGLQPIQSRYATPPVGPPRPPSVTLPFQPRTSSPLARSASATQQYQLRSLPVDNAGSSNVFPSESRRPSLRSYHTERPLPPPPEIQRSQETTTTTPAIFGDNVAVPSEPEKKKRSLQYHHPLEQSQIISPDIHAFDSPRRSQTQSPSTMMPQSEVRVTKGYESHRRASVDDSTSPGISNPPFVSTTPPTAQLPLDMKAKPRINYLVPSDGREKDPLERWKGCPIFFFGFGGITITSFPKQIPRFTAGHSTPLIKCSPGEVKLRTAKILSLDDKVASFPGPLKSKSKKKDVLDWLGKSIQQLGQQYVSISPDQALEDSRKRHEEKILLWKVLQVLVENDGVIDRNPTAVTSIRMTLSPELITGESSGQISYDSILPLKRISKSSIPRNSTDTEDPEALEGLRRLLLHGEREKAAWHAADQRLWGHALLLASTLSRDVWKQVIQEFVHNEVKTYGDNTESLAALYDIFAGNWEESIDELVPPSARAGLQMVSKTAGPGPVKNALDGLDRWRETLSLVMSNRTPDDGKALVSLGQLLSKYGRVEAAHICFIFARSQTLFGGPDDSQVNVVLFGADHVQQPFDYARDLDSVLLTEVYEFAFNILASPSAPTTMPHLQAHKLYHATILAEYGYRDEAQQYCDNIQNILKATTKLSPYYNNRLFNALDDLSSRLKQAPKDGSASWITRPSIDKVSGSVWSRFNQFVNGGDSDAASAGSGNATDGEAGPFSKVSGDTPTISRGPSPSDPYGSYVNGGLYTPGPPGLTISNTPHAPSGVYTPRSSLEQPRHAERFGNSLHDPQRAHVDSVKQANLRKQSSYSSMPASSPDSYKKLQLDARQSIPRPSTSNLSSSKRDYSPTPPVLSPGELSERSPFNPSYLNGSYEPFPSNSPSYSHNLTSPDGYTTNMNFEQSPVPQRPSSETEELIPSKYESSPTYIETHPAHPTGHEEFHDQETPRSYHFNSNTNEPSQICNQPSSSSYDPPSTAADVPELSYGYEPPTTYLYNPSTYEPNSEPSEISPVESKPNKKSFMDDDDDDFETKAAALLRKDKNQLSREPDDAVRRAAEEDGKYTLPFDSYIFSLKIIY